jgi:hypothetical protein
MSNGYGFVQQQGAGPAQSTGTLGNASIFRSSKPAMSGYVVGGAHGTGKVDPNSLFQVEQQQGMTADQLVNRSSDTWAGRYKGLVNLVYHDDDVSEYSGGGVHGDGMGSIMSDNVKVPVARVTGGVIDKDTNKLNPYGKIVVGKMFVGQEQIPIPLDLRMLEEQVDRVNKGHTTAEQRIQAALASASNVPTAEQIHERRQQLEQRAPEHRMNNLLDADGNVPSFNQVIQEADYHAQQKQAAIPQVPVNTHMAQVPQVPQQTQSVFAQQQPAHDPVPPQYQQQQPIQQAPMPVQSTPAAPDYAQIVSQVMGAMKAQEKTAMPAEPEPQQFPQLHTDDIRVTVKGNFGTSKTKYKHYEKEDNMLILMYNMDDNVYTPPNSSQTFSMTIEKQDGNAETYNAMFMGVAFEIKALRLGFQVYFVTD